MTGTVVLLSGIPFWFLPKSLIKQGHEQSQSKSTELATVAEQENFLPEENEEHEAKEKPVSFQELAKGIMQLQRLHARNMSWSTYLEIKSLIVNWFYTRKNRFYTSNRDFTMWHICGNIY